MTLCETSATVRLVRAERLLRRILTHFPPEERLLLIARRDAVCGYVTPELADELLELRAFINRPE